MILTIKNYMNKRKVKYEREKKKKLYSPGKNVKGHKKRSLNGVENVTRKNNNSFHVRTFSML